MECTHEKSNIAWDSNPDLGAGYSGEIFWFGKCSCGKRFREVYAQQDGIEEVEAA